MPKISNFLLLRGNLAKALGFYTDVFSTALSITSQTPYGPLAPQVGTSTIMSATMDLYGQEFKLFDFGPEDAPTTAVSFFITCDGGQAEVDRLWDGLARDGGEKSKCGWVRDPFGFFWQIVPKELEELIGTGDQEKSKRVMQALWKMGKIDIKGLEEAASAEKVVE